MEPDSDEEKDESLNVKSDKFDPLQALYSEKVIVPYPSAPTLDNVAKVTSLLSRNEQLVNKPLSSVKKEKEVEPSTSSQVKHEGKSMRENKGATTTESNKNLLTRMAQTTGPLSCLRTCMDKRIRVKVWTRDAKQIRGYCLGFVAAFDKHWNVAMEDVQEVWTRRKRRKKFLLGESTSDIPLKWRAMGPMVTPPQVIVKKQDRKTETCERHVKQMLVRGEQIAFISIADM